MIDAAAARRFLTAHLGRPVEVELVGEGAWSRCFAFEDDGRELVARFGKHGDDFATDALAASLAPESVPVPEVIELGTAPGGFFAISTRARGVPLESLDADGWQRVLAHLFDVLAELRTVEPARPGWGAIANPPFTSWCDLLLAVEVDEPPRRTQGWRPRLAASPVGDAPFRRGHARLAELAAGLQVERRMVHADLINRNVLVEGGHITGVFDWGCSIYGDPLYDIAWLEFWKGWYPAMLDIDFAGEARARFADNDLEARLLACKLHIGLDHQAYNAHLGDIEALERIAAQTDALLSGP